MTHRTHQIAWRIAAAGLIAAAVLGAQANNQELLEDFGFEVYEVDPEQDAARRLEQQKKFEQSLPAFIDPETLAIDQRLDTTKIETPAAPEWTAVEREAETTANDPLHCCLQVLRATRYEAETACISQGNKVWEIVSVPLVDNPEQGVQSFKQCQVFYSDLPDISFEAVFNVIQDANGEVTTVTPATQPSVFRCRARSQVKCFTPTTDNAQFVAPDVR